MDSNVARSLTQVAEAVQKNVGPTQGEYQLTGKSGQYETD